MVQNPKLCLECGNPFPKRESKNPKRNKKFCSPKCRSRYNSKIYFKRHKNDPEYREKRNNILKNWIKKNKEVWNKKQRESMRKRLNIPKERFRINTIQKR